MVVVQWIGPGTPVPPVAALAVVGTDAARHAAPVARLRAGHLQVADTAPADPLGWLDELADEHGIGPGLVAVLVDGACPPALLEVPRLHLVRLAPTGRPGDLGARLWEQATLVDGGAVPGIDDDPRWVVPLVRGATPLVRVDEALAVVSDGVVGTRGAYEEDGLAADELVLVTGVYTADAVPELLPAPVWTRVAMDPPPEAGPRWFDLRTGVLARGRDGDPMRSVRFACLAHPGTVAMRVDGPLRAGGGPPLRLPDVVDGVRGRVDVTDDRASAETSSGRSRVVAAAVQHRRGGRGGGLDRLAAYAVDQGSVAGRQDAPARLVAAERLGVDGLLAAHRRAWAQRWHGADAAVEGDDALTLAVRFALHHLLVAAPDEGEAAVGARGLTGTAYAGHVFWDADVFVLPALAAIRPRAALAMLAYRLARLPAARDAAAAEGHAGARFPWESTDLGEEVTPRVETLPDGTVAPILTRDRALHITADVAWAACRWAAWTGDRAWVQGPGRDLVVEPARFWASRIEVDADGTGHLRGVVGPDEYHGPVDDDVYTNVLARWNLRVAGSFPGIAPAERRRWLALAACLVDGYDPVAGRHEQFAGFDALEPLMISTLTDLPVAADVLLGRERVARAQVVKQPDVLMAHHVLPGVMPAGSLAGDLAHEGPRLAHGSSLSPAIVASLLARAGRPDEAEPLFRLAATLDLDDVTGTTAAGLHLATMGGLWQALAGGFVGLDATADALVVAPALPSSWPGVRVTVAYHGVRTEIEARHDAVTVTTDGPVPIQFGQDAPAEIVDGRRTRAPVVTAPASEVSA